MDAYAGEVQNMHPFYAYDSPARAKDMDLLTTKSYALPGNVTAGIQHGSVSFVSYTGTFATLIITSGQCQSNQERHRRSRTSTATSEIYKRTSNIASKISSMSRNG